VKAWHNSDEIITQLRLNSKLKRVDGSMFFSSKSFTNNLLGINEKLQSQIYQKPTLIPECKTIAPIQISAPRMVAISNGNLQWESVKNAKCYVIYVFGKNDRIRLNKADSILTITSQSNLKLNSGFENYKYVVTAVSRTNTESCTSKAFGFEK